MSTAEQEFADHYVRENAEPNETPERAFLIRAYDAELAVAKGRTVDVRVVPYGERATVADGFGGVPRGMAYEEEWMPGVFGHQLNAAHRVTANTDHEPGIRGIVGHGLQLREASDGFHGSFKMHDNADGEKALMLVNEGVFRGVSLEAQPVKNRRTTGGVVQRIKAHLRAIAFVREGAFSGAEVLAVREAEFIDETELDLELRIPEMDPELLERCKALGIALPQRFEAHPETDTSAESDTSADGTRPNEETATSEEENA